MQPGLYALIGAAATLGGVFRSSISLVVIMVEGTGGISFVFCIIVAVMVSNAVSGWFHRHGVYHRDLGRNAAVAFLSGEPPRRFAALTARHLMASPARASRLGSPPDRARELLATTTHNGFPVVDARGRLLGMVLRSQLSVLLHAEKHAEPRRGRARETRVGRVHARRASQTSADARPILPEGYGAEVEEGGFGGASPQRLSVEALARHVESDSGHLGAEAERRAASRRSSRASPATTTTTRARARTRPAVDRRPRGWRAERRVRVRVRFERARRVGDRRRARGVRGGGGRRGGDGERGGRVVSRRAGQTAGAIGVSADGGFARVRRGGRRGRGDGENTLDVGSFMHAAPLAVQAGFSATRVHVMFTSLGLRHLTVTDASNRVLGIITRKDVMRAAEDE